jgi:hypothetical protein
MQALETRIEAAYLWHCSPEAAYQWLERREMRDAESRVDQSPWQEQQDRQILEYVLCRRRHPLVDLGLARFGLSGNVLRTVHRRGKTAVRCAAWSNSGAMSLSIGSRGWWERGDLSHLVNGAHIAELTAFASNPRLPDSIIEALLRREDSFSGLHDDRFAKVLLALSENPRMAREYDSIYMDGWAEYSYHKPFEVAWSLVHTLPTNQHWAAILQRLLAKCPPPHLFEALDEAIDRWRIDLPKREGDLGDWQGDSFYLRSRLADLKKVDTLLLNANDLALRLSFYRRFHPKEFKHWPSFLQRDGESFADAALQNLELWRTAEDRENLSRLCWAVPDPTHGMMMPNLYRGRESRLRELHPDWFRDVDAVSIAPEQPTSGSIEAKVDGLIREAEAMRNELSRSLRESADRVRVPSWAWFLIGAAAFFLLREVFRW